jgi:hypothetical protein
LPDRCVKHSLGSREAFPIAALTATEAAMTGPVGTQGSRERLGIHPDQGSVEGRPSFLILGMQERNSVRR